MPPIMIINDWLLLMRASSAMIQDSPMLVNYSLSRVVAYPYSVYFRKPADREVTRIEKRSRTCRRPAAGAASPVEKMPMCTTTRARNAILGMHRTPRWRAVSSSPRRWYPGRVLGRWYHWYSHRSAFSALSSPSLSLYGRFHIHPCRSSKHVAPFLTHQTLTADLSMSLPFRKLPRGSLRG